jgi:hypothetical protein
VLAEHLGDRQHQVGRRGSDGQLATELEADDEGNEHRYGLAEHGRLCLDTSHAPSQDPEAVDHRGVAVRPDHSVGIRLATTRHDHAREVLDVDLMHDSRAGRHHLELLECTLTPSEELVALTVALVFEGGVEICRIRASEIVGNDAVIDHELGRSERLDLRRISPEIHDRLPHRGQVDHHGNAREVLHDDACGRELDLLGGLGTCLPSTQRTNLRFRDVGAVFGAQEVLQQDAMREGQGLRTGNDIDAEDLVVTISHGERGPRSQAVLTGSHDVSLLRRRGSSPGFHTTARRAGRDQALAARESEA